MDVFLLGVKLYSGDGSPIFCLLGRPHPQTTPPPFTHVSGSYP